MAEHGLTAYFIPSADPHQSEYPADRWQSRAWLSGFTGSAGILIVTADFAGLWTDSRYFLQAESQLRGSGIELMKLKVPHTPEYVEWMQEKLPAGSVLGLDGGIVSLTQANMLQQRLEPCGIDLEPRFDLIREIWTDRPLAPATAITEHPEKFTGESRVEKLRRIRSVLRQKGLSYYLFVALDDIAWTLNIRATDVPYNPVAVSFLVVGEEDEAHWFVGPDRVPDALAAQLEKDNVQLYPYTEIRQFLLGLPAGTRVGVDPATISLRSYSHLEEAEPVRLPSPVAPWKATKNGIEIQHLRQAMRRDGVALLRLRRWLDEELAYRTVTEVEVAERLAAFRAEQEHYRGESFGAIVGYKGNGAIPHYKPEPNTCAAIRPEGILLIDSGGQYLDGTTDITRTFALSEPTLEQKLHFTLVLKGHIELARARFPRGTTGVQLDTLARLPLWRAGLNYGHGTGHGVGFFLNVHEGPQSISPNPATLKSRTPFASGMVTSNEPAYYRAGHYGIRIENLILCLADGRNDEGQWFRFETLTLFPIDHRLIRPELLTREEIDWLNNYHERVERELTPLLRPEERDWLHEECRPVLVGVSG